MNFRWGEFGPGAGIDLPFVSREGQVVDVPEGPYLLTVDREPIYLRIGETILEGEGTPLMAGTMLQIFVPEQERWAVRSRSGLGRLTLTREAPLD